MIRSFTIVESRDESGNVEFNVSGDLPIEEVARDLVLIALRVLPPQAPLPEREKN